MLGIITEDELVKELDNLGVIGDMKINLPGDIIVDKSNNNNNDLPMAPPADVIEEIEKSLSAHGRNKGDINVPMELRKVIAGEAIEGAKNGELAKVFNVSNSSVSAYKNGSTSTASYGNKEKELETHNKLVKAGIISKSNNVLKRALRHITDDKLKEASARDLAAIAKSMSGVNRDLTGDNDSGNRATAQVVIFRPRMKEEEDYEVIDVRPMEH